MWQYDAEMVRERESRDTVMTHRNGWQCQHAHGQTWPENLKQAQKNVFLMVSHHKL